MGSKGGGSAPTPPNYAELIPLQEQSNMNQFGSMLNSSRVDSTTPYGTTSWTRPSTPDGTWQVNQQLDPAQQYLYDQDLRVRAGQGGISEGMLENVANVYGQPANFAGQLPGYNQINGPQYGGPQYTSNVNSRDDAEQAIYNRQMRFMQPDYAQREKDLQSQLLSQGLNIGDDAYQRSIGEFQAQRDRAMADVRDQSIIGGGREATEELNRGRSTAMDWFNTGMQGSQFNQGEANRSLQWALQNIGQQQQDRSRTLNEMNAFRTGQQIQTPGLPGQMNTPNLQGVDQLGAARAGYQDQLGAWNADQSGSNNFMQGLFGLGSAFLGTPAGATAVAGMFSDERLKKDIRKVGETTEGRNLYTWKWKGTDIPDFGVIAQENPDIAFEGPEGLLRVDYNKVG